MRVKYFQLRRDLICLVLNVLGWDNDIAYFFSSLAKIKCKEKDAVTHPNFFKRRVTYLKKFINKAEVVKKHDKHRCLGAKPSVSRSIVSKPTADFILLNSQPMSISHNYLMHFIMQSKTLKFYCPAQPTNNNFSVVMKCITKAFIPLKSVTFNLRRKINFAIKWSMLVFLAVHLIKENKILASTAFVSKKKKKTY